MIGIALGGLVWFAFYDDFVCICRAGTEDQTDKMVRLLFQTLGWELSSDPEKDKPYCSIFQALGVEFDMSNVHNVCFHVGNTMSRKAELKDKIKDILSKGELDPKTAESLRSRLPFKESQMYGRFS